MSVRSSSQLQSDLVKEATDVALPFGVQQLWVFPALPE
jgi:hypothetical protein